MQDRPTAAELLRDIAGLLEGDLLGAVSGPMQHNVRVAGNLTRIVQRELELGPAAEERDNAALAALLGHAGATDDLSAELASRLRAKEDGLAAAAWPVLLDVVKGKLAIVKPGHDDYDFAGE